MVMIFYFEDTKIVLRICIEIELKYILLQDYGSTNFYCLKNEINSNVDYYNIAFSKSPIMSSMFSKPTETRIKPSVMPF